MDIPSSLLGKIVEIEFVDHTHGTNVTDVAQCIIWGKLLEATGMKVVVQQWQSDKSLTEDTENSVLFQAAIRSITVLEPVK